MHGLRGRWVALFSGVLLLTLSVSSAFGADPIDDTDDPRGQTIAAFVHSLIFGTDEPTDEETPDGLPIDEEGLDDEESAEADRADGAAHGACVSEVARDPDAVGGPNDNHGGAVSEAARETCWDEEAPEEEPTDPEVEGQEADSHGACVSEVARDKEARGGPNDNHGGAVSEAARETCGEEPEEELGDVEADATAEEDGPASGRGGGNGKGWGQGAGGRP